MTKFKNIAVVLRGHIRTWNLIHKDVFKFYDSIAENVDYFVVTWEEENTRWYIQETFKSNNKNLKAYEMVKPPTEHTFKAYLGPAFLSYWIAPFIKNENITANYDCVIDSRPDILCRKKPHLSILDAEPNCLYTSGFESGHRRNPTIESDPYKGCRSVAISDWFFISSLDVFCKMSERFADRSDTGSQIQFMEWAQNRGISLCLIDWVETVIVRPFLPEYASGDLTTDQNWQKLHELRNLWTRMPFEEKLEVLQKTNQRVPDWDTPTMRNFNR